MKKMFILFLPCYLLADFIEIDTQKILNKHNELREKHFKAPLKYSKMLEMSSQTWALHLAKEEGCKMVHSHGEFGENIFWASAEVRKTKRSDEKEWHVHRSAQRVKSEKPVQDWYDEIIFYDYMNNSCKKGEMCGHYTQVVWKNTKEVGCAAYQCADKSQVWVCQYKPAGNYVGQKPF
jgi:pathogenesis-related protein 1